MKRILSLALVLIFALSLCSCKEEKKKNSSTVDIEYHANLGQIPENDLSLGMTPDEVKEALEKKQKEELEKGEEYGFNEQEGNTNVLITDGTYDYYCKKAESEKGINYIVSYTDAFGFKIGDVILEVKEALADYDVKEEAVTEENAFFYFGSEGATLLKIEFPKNTVMFIFEDNALCATAIYTRS